MAIVTCHTAGCPSADSPVDLPVTYVDPDTGETVTVDGVYCGACGQPITDIQTEGGDG